jgi:hypothetical protein
MQRRVQNSAAVMDPIIGSVNTSVPSRYAERTASMPRRTSRTLMPGIADDTGVSDEALLRAERVSIFV